MTKRFVTADWHLGEDRFQIMHRPGFKNAQDMIDHFVDLHNALVKPDDLVYFVGDAVNQKTPEFLPQVAKFNGRKILFRGNHDRVFTDEQLQPYFEGIVPEGEGWVVRTDGQDYWVTHYPTQARTTLFNLVGHIHSAWKVQLNAINVGVDVCHYRPMDLDEDIPFLRKAIFQFYDRDVWSAYHLSNQEFEGVRGAQTRYLDAK